MEAAMLSNDVRTISVYVSAIAFSRCFFCASSLLGSFTTSMKAALLGNVLKRT